jgi:hypothetical protein
VIRRARRRRIAPDRATTRTGRVAAGVLARLASRAVAPPDSRREKTCAA